MRSFNKLILNLVITSLLSAASLCSPMQAGDVEPAELEARRQLIQDADRILFLGDSITYAGSYVSYFELWLRTQDWVGEMPHVINTGLSSETVSGLSEEGHAGGQFPRPDLAERIDRVLATTKPDLVFACYGMNCAIYQPFNDERFARYQTGISMLREKVEQAGAKLVLLTPPYHDDQMAGHSFSYNAVLDKYTEWLLTLRDDGVPVIDLHRVMQAAVETKREVEPDFTYQKDAVHPDAAGHWVMATALIDWFGGTAAATPREMLSDVADPDELLKLQFQQMAVLRDAYLTSAGHKRPGVKTGKPITEAESIARQLEGEIQDALTK